MKGMILAAGFGTRLGALTAHTPKCLIDVAGVPILGRVVKRLKEAGVTDLAINTHYLAEQVSDFVKNDGVFNGLKVQIFYEEEILGTGGGIKNAAKFLSEGDGDFIVHNGDTYEEFDLVKLIKDHQESSAIATLAVIDKQTKSCVLRDRDNKFKGLWSEGAPIVAGLEPLTYTGVQCVSSKIFRYMQNFEGNFSIFPVYEEALKDSQSIMTAHQGEACFIDIGTPEDLERLRKKLR